MENCKLESQLDLKMSNVLEDVLMLLARLEFDRRRIEKQLKDERKNYEKLKYQIENSAMHRAQLLPLKVQQEHEMCVADITELNFHIMFNTMTENKLSRKVEVEEKIFTRLSDEIRNVRSTMPLIDEKIQIEIDLLQQVNEEQAKVSELLRKANDRYEQVVEKTQISNNKARIERETIEAELAASKRDLNKAM